MPHLILPTTLVRASYLQGGTETACAEGLSTTWLEEAAADFAGFVERRRAVRELWGRPGDRTVVRGRDRPPGHGHHPPPAHSGPGAPSSP